MSTPTPTYTYSHTAATSRSSQPTSDSDSNSNDITVSSVGFIGLGNMGTPMALNLRRNLPRRVPLFIYDVDKDAMERFVQRAREFVGVGEAGGEAEGEDRCGDGDQDGDGEGWIVKCGNAREVGAKSEVVFTIVPEGSHVRAVYLDPIDGLLASASPSQTQLHPTPTQTQTHTHKSFIDCSTIDTQTSLHIHARVTSLSTSTSTPSTSTTYHFYDAPVSGGTHGALAGTLTFMVGVGVLPSSSSSPSSPSSPRPSSSSSTHPPTSTPTPDPDPHYTSTLLPLLHSISPHGSIFRLGAPSLGLVAKLSNNYLSGLIAIATSEAMNMGMRCGVDAGVLRDVFGVSSGGSWVNETTNPVPSLCPLSAPSRGYSNGFKVELMRKDFNLAISTAESVGARLVLGGVGKEVWEAVCADERCKGLDARVVYRWLGGRE